MSASRPLLSALGWGGRTLKSERKKTQKKECHATSSYHIHLPQTRRLVVPLCRAKSTTKWL